MIRAIAVSVLMPLFLCGCIASKYDMHDDMQATRFIPEGAYQGMSDNKVLIKYNKENCWNEHPETDKVSFCLYTLKEDPNVAIVQERSEKDGSGYYFASYDASSSEVTFYDFKAADARLLPSNLQNLVKRLHDDLEVKDSVDTLRVLRGILRAGLVKDPQVNHIVLKRIFDVATPAPTLPPHSEIEAATSLTPLQQMPRETRLALVIGNSHYSEVPYLPNPNADADHISAALSAAGFVTDVKKDLTREQMENALSQFARKSETADWAVLYFAGHGIEMMGNNYLIPTDAQLATDTAVQFEAVPLDQAMAAVRGARKLRLVILDACRANPFAPHMRLSSANRAPTRGLGRPPEADPGSLVVYAAQEGEVAGDGAMSEGSPFATALVTELAQPGVDIRRLFDRVSDDVIESSGNHQHPQIYGRLPGRQDFYFKSPNL